MYVFCYGYAGQKHSQSPPWFLRNDWHLVWACDNKNCHQNCHLISWPYPWANGYNALEASQLQSIFWAHQLCSQASCWVFHYEGQQRPHSVHFQGIGCIILVRWPSKGEYPDLLIKCPDKLTNMIENNYNWIACLQNLKDSPNIPLRNSISNFNPPAKILKEENAVCKNTITIKVISFLMNLWHILSQKRSQWVTLRNVHLLG